MRRKIILFWCINCFVYMSVFYIFIWIWHKCRHKRDELVHFISNFLLFGIWSYSIFRSKWLYFVHFSIIKILKIHYNSYNFGRMNVNGIHFHKLKNSLRKKTQISYQFFNRTFISHIFCPSRKIGKEKKMRWTIVVSQCDISGTMNSMNSPLFQLLHFNISFNEINWRTHMETMLSVANTCSLFNSQHKRINLQSSSWFLSSERRLHFA